MDPGYVAAHIEEDRHHWWFLGRRAVLSSVLRRVLPRGALRLAEIGCGTGSLLSVSAAFGDVVGIEACPDLLEVARRSGFTVLRGSLPDDLPIEAGSLDGVLLFDVLEHISDDRAALRAVGELLKPGGTLVLTVPAYGGTLEVVGVIPLRRAPVRVDPDHRHDRESTKERAQQQPGSSRRAHGRHLISGGVGQ